MTTTRGRLAKDSKQQAATNLTWHDHKVTRQDRWKARAVGSDNRNINKGAVVWFTGLSACGKSTIANEVDYRLNQEGGFRTYLLDGDNVRHGLCRDLGFSAQDRAENIRRVGEVAKLMADSGLIVLCAFISPYRTDRDQLRASIQTEGSLPFVEVFVDASLQVCEERDPKGLYQKARAGIIKNFTGIDDPYEEPLNPELVLQNSSGKTVPDLAQEVIQWLRDKEILQLA